MNQISPNRSARFGLIASIGTLLLLIVLVAVNLLVSLIPSRFTVLDSTYSGLYTLSKTTENAVKALDEDVTVYFLCDDGAEDATLRTFLDRYEGLSSRVTVKTVDPVENPTFTSNYTDKTLSNYSVIVTSGKRSLCLDYYDLYLWENEALGILTAEEYTALLSDSYGSYILSYYETVNHFNGESKLTNAIAYVTADTLPKIYAASNHGEADLGSSFLETLKANAYEVVSDFSILAYGSVPEDCDILLLNAPESDLSVKEAEEIGTYLENGGRILLTTAAGRTYVDTEVTVTDENGNETTETEKNEFPNLLSLLSKYGLSATNGAVVETDSSMSYSDYPVVLLPTENAQHSALSDASGSTMVFYVAHGILLDESAENVTLSSLFTTSDGSYTAATDSEELYEKTEDSLTGPFSVGAAAECGDSRIVWFSSEYALDDSVDALVSGGNHAYAVSVCNWLSDKEDAIALPSVSLEEPMLIVTGDALTVFAAFFCGVIPLSVLIGGLAYRLRRRRA